MVSVNGKGNEYKFLIGAGFTPKETKKAAETQETVPVAKVETKEYGDKLLEQVQPNFVKVSRLEGTKAAEMAQIFAGLGIGNRSLPTVAQYTAVAGHVNAASKGIEEIGVRANAGELFSSNAFAELNAKFGIA